MTGQPISRRRALALFGLGTASVAAGVTGWAAGLGAPARGRLQPAASGQALAQPQVAASRGGVLDVQLSAAPGVRLAGRDTSAFGFNGTSPGPTLRVRPGDLLRAGSPQACTSTTNTPRSSSTTSWTGPCAPRRLSMTAATSASASGCATCPRCGRSASPPTDQRKSWLSSRVPKDLVDQGFALVMVGVPARSRRSAELRTALRAGVWAWRCGRPALARSEALMGRPPPRVVGAPPRVPRLYVDHQTGSSPVPGRGSGVPTACKRACAGCGGAALGRLRAWWLYGNAGSPRRGRVVYAVVGAGAGCVVRPPPPRVRVGGCGQGRRRCRG